MKSRPVIDQVARGRAVRERFSKQAQIPADIAPFVTKFSSSQENLEASINAADEACRARDGALDLIGTLDGGLDVILDDVASLIPLAKLAPRKSPFSGFSKYKPSELTNLAYAKEVAAARDLVANVAAKAPPPELTQKLAECLQQAAKVEQALTALSGPQIEYEQKRAARDEAAMAWSKDYAKLKVRAQAAYEDDPATFKSLFAPPEDVQRPVTRRAKKSDKKPTGNPAVPE